MKLVYLANSVIPSQSANSVHVMRMCQAFARLEHEVHLIIPDQADGATEGAEDPFAYYGIAPLFRIHRLPLSQRRGKKRLLAREMARRAADLQPDRVYARSLAAALAAVEFDQPVVFELHHLPVEEPGLAAAVRRTGMKLGGKLAEQLRRSEQGSESRPFTKMLALGGFEDPRSMFTQLVRHRNFLQLVTITHALKDRLLQSWPELEGRILVAPDGADPPPEDLPPARLKGSGEALEVGYCGQLYPGKGMEVIAELAPLCPSARFHIVGGRSEDLELWRARLRDCSNVIFHGFVEPQAVGGYIKAFDVCLLPNQPRVRTRARNGRAAEEIGAYTSPLKLFEYMAAGKPIVASDLEVLKEILVDGQTAVLCRYDDPHAWAEALNRLSRDVELRERLGRQARQAFAASYSWLERATQLVQAINAPTAVLPQDEIAYAVR